MADFGEVLQALKVAWAEDVKQMRENPARYRRPIPEIPSIEIFVVLTHHGVNRWTAEVISGEGLPPDLHLMARAHSRDATLAELRYKFYVHLHTIEKLPDRDAREASRKLVIRISDTHVIDTR